MKLAQKRIVLTGASAGIGKALLDLLVQRDVQVVAADLLPEKIREVPGQVFPLRCDVSAQSEVDALFDSALEILGHIDIFIANAGFAYYEKLEQEDWGHIHKIVSTNLISPIYSIEKMRRLNRNREYLVVVNASAMAKLAMPGYALYSATKAALDSFAAAYRLELDDRGKLILVYPIATSTGFFKHAGADIPVAWPVQSAAVVAQSIIKGIENETPSVYPSKIFEGILLLQRFNPLVPYLYTKVEQARFKRWSRGNPGKTTR